MTEQIDDHRIIAETNIEEKDWVTFYRFSMHQGKHNTLISCFFVIFWILTGTSLLIFDLYYFGFKYGPYLYLMDVYDWLTAMVPMAFAVLYFYNRNISGKRHFAKARPPKTLRVILNLGQQIL